MKLYFLERQVLNIENWQIARGYGFTCTSRLIPLRCYSVHRSWAGRSKSLKSWPGMAMAAMRCNDKCFNGPRIGCQLDSSLGTVQGFDSDWLERAPPKKKNRNLAWVRFFFFVGLGFSLSPFLDLRFRGFVFGFAVVGAGGSPPPAPGFDFKRVLSLVMFDLI